MPQPPPPSLPGPGFRILPQTAALHCHKNLPHPRVLASSSKPNRPSLWSSLAHTWVPKLFGSACYCQASPISYIATQYCLQSSYSSILHLSLFVFSLIGGKKPKTTKRTISQCLEQVRVLCTAALRADRQLGHLPCKRRKAALWSVQFRWVGLKPDIPTLTHCGEGA